MKYSTATLLLLVQGIVAAPSLLGQFRHKGANNKITSSGEDITLSIMVSQSPFGGALNHASDYDICWLLCAKEEVLCPEHWRSKQEGECWTCCYSGSN